MIERDGGTLYCSVLFFAPDGGLLGKHRKLMPTAAERLVWGQGDGSTMPVFETPIGSSVPSSAGKTTCRSCGCTCTPRDPDLLRPHGRRPRNLAGDVAAHRARGAVFCPGLQPVRAASRLSGRLSGDPGRRPRDDHVARGQLHHRPARPDPGRPAFEGETILAAELDLAEIARGKFDFDVVGHYARPDVFRLAVNESARSAVVRGTCEEMPPRKRGESPSGPAGSEPLPG